MLVTPVKAGDATKSIEEVVAEAVKEAVQAVILPKIAREVKAATKEAMAELREELKKEEEEMPKKFTECVKSGGKVRTIKPTEDTHAPVCVKGGKSTIGEVKKTKKKGKK